MFDVKDGNRTLSPLPVPAHNATTDGPPISLAGDAGAWHATLMVASANMDKLAEVKGERRAKLRDVARPVVNRRARVGRNAPCACGSGQKRKRCCGRRG